MYFAVFGLVSRNMELARAQGLKLLLTAVGIALGFIIVSNFMILVKNVFLHSR